MILGETVRLPVRKDCSPVLFSSSKAVPAFPGQVLCLGGLRARLILVLSCGGLVLTRRPALVVDVAMLSRKDKAKQAIHKSGATYVATELFEGVQPNSLF